MTGATDTNMIEETAWDDCKIAFGYRIYKENEIWNHAEKWPEGFELVETTGQGARDVAIFRCHRLPTEADAAQIRLIITELEALSAGDDDE